MRTSNKRASRVEQLIAVALIILAVVAIGIARSVWDTDTLLIAIFALSIFAIATAFAWGTHWEPFWVETVAVIGVLGVCYSIAQCILAGQLLLGLGGFGILIAAIVAPIVRRQIRQQIRDGLL